MAYKRISPQPVVEGGTGVQAVTVAPTATAFSGWDANKNLSANSFIDGYRTTATSATTTTLVVGDAQQQYFTGSTTQTVLLPVTGTLVLGQSYTVVNNSSGVVTVQSSGANTLQAMAANTELTATVISTSGTGTSSWSWIYIALTPPSSGIPTIGSSTANAIVTWNGTGGNAVLNNSTVTISSAGVTTATAQPAFQAAANSGPTNVTGDGTTYTLANLGTTVFDQASNFSGSETFTAPVTGIYLLTFSIALSGVGPAHTFGAVDIVTTSKTYTVLGLNVAAIVGETVSTEVILNGSVIANMAATNTAVLDLRVYNGAKTVGVGGDPTQTFFCGCKLC